MPLVLDTPEQPVEREPGMVDVGLLMNLGDGGMKSGERQILDLLAQADGDIRVRLRLFALPSIARTDAARAGMDGRYHGLDALLASRLDGLFVTGAEPRAATLEGEAFWPDLTRVIDWAASGTRSTIWSCLGAHAAVLHLDGIARVPLGDKCTGIFPVETTGEHPLLAGVGAAPRVPHSRWNGLDEAALVAAGYRVLTRGAIGVDSFVRREPGGSLFVHLQGHPEYDAGALGRELRRDLAGWQAHGGRPPCMPRNYFAPEVEAAMTAFFVEKGLPPEIGEPAADPNGFARTLFANWLALLQPSSRAEGEAIQTPPPRSRASPTRRPGRVAALAMTGPGS